MSVIPCLRPQQVCLALADLSWRRTAITLEIGTQLQVQPRFIAAACITLCLGSAGFCFEPAPTQP